MKNYNHIFSVIKKHCSGNDPIQEPCLEKVVNEVVITKGMNSIYQYLDVFQDLGLIEYSANTKMIALTEKGKRTEKLFS